MFPLNPFDPIFWGIKLGEDTVLSSAPAIEKAGGDAINTIRDSSLHFADAVTSIPKNISQTVQNATKGITDSVASAGKSLGGFVSGTLTKTIVILVLVLIGFVFINAMAQKVASAK